MRVARHLLEAYDCAPARRVQNGIVEAWRALRVRCGSCEERIYLGSDGRGKPFFSAGKIWHQSCYIEEAQDK